MTDFIRFWQLVFHMQNHNTTYLCSSQRSLDLFLSLFPDPHFALQNKESNRKLHLSQLFLALFFDLPHSFYSLEFLTFLSSFVVLQDFKQQLSILCLLPIWLPSPYRVELSFPFSAFLRRQRPSLSKFFVNFVVFSGHFFSGSKEDLVVF